MIAQVELLVDLLAEGEGVNQTVLAGGTLAGNYRAHLGTGAAAVQSTLLQELHHRRNVVIPDALNFDGEAGGHGNLAAAEFVSGFCDGTHLVGGDPAVAGDDADIEYIGITLVLQTAQALDLLDLLRSQSFLFHGSFSSIYVILLL